MVHVHCRWRPSSCWQGCQKCISSEACTLAPMSHAVCLTRSRMTARQVWNRIKQRPYQQLLLFQVRTLCFKDGLEQSTFVTALPKAATPACSAFRCHPGCQPSGSSSHIVLIARQRPRQGYQADPDTLDGIHETACHPGTVLQTSALDASSCLLW